MSPELIPPEATTEVVSTLSLIMEWIVQFVHEFGYLGIFIMTFIESTFIPVPSEVTMVPAGYLIHQGEMDFLWVMAASVSGTLGGAMFNYWIARTYGLALLEKYGKYFLITPKKMQKMELFFEQHGAISTFSGRLIPGVRHYISFPAGLAKMKLRQFCLYTALGGGIWMMALIGLGYFIGEEQERMKHYLPMMVWTIVAALAVFVSVYIWRVRKRL